MQKAVLKRCFVVDGSNRPCLMLSCLKCLREGGTYKSPKGSFIRGASRHLAPQPTTTRGDPSPNEERSCFSLAISARHSCMDSPVDAMVYPQPISGWHCLHCDSAPNGQQRNWLCRGNYPAPWWNKWQVWYCNNQRVPNDGPYYFWWYGKWPS